MTVTVASFRKSHPIEFGNVANYPDNAIQYWLTVAGVLFQSSTGNPPAAASFTGQLVNSNTLTITNVTFGTLTPEPMLLQGLGVPATGVITAQLTGVLGGAGTYEVNFNATIGPEAMVALQSNAVTGASVLWGPGSLVPNSPPTTILDIATEMWVAHQIVLEKQAMDAARAGGDPGTKIGIVTNKSVNGVSIGYDSNAITGDDKSAGYYNQTIYGMRYWRLARARASGPFQIGIGVAPPFLFFGAFGLLGAGSAWGGPFPGIGPSDTGFSG